MSEQRHKWAPRIWWAVVLLILVNPLSAGPMDCVYCRCERHPAFQASVRATYGPLGFLCAKSLVINDLVGSYLGLCHRIMDN
jgi:hypothetical protein